MNPQRPDDDEWAILKMWFPSLVKKNCWITGQPTTEYNCVAFTLGIYDRWIDPDSPLAAFQNQYSAFNYRPVQAAVATVDGWGFGSNGKPMTHASRPAADLGFAAQGLWESKIGDSWQITHDRGALVSPKLYGTVLTNLAEDAFDLSGGRPQLPEMEPELTGEERAQLTDTALTEVDDGSLIGEFTLRRERFLAAVRRSASSDTADFAVLPEAGSLVELGTGISPLIVAQLDDEDGFLLLGVLEALQPGLTAIEHDPLAGRQSLARLVARSWLAR